MMLYKSKNKPLTKVKKVNNFKMFAYLPDTKDVGVSHSLK